MRHTRGAISLKKKTGHLEGSSASRTHNTRRQGFKEPVLRLTSGPLQKHTNATAVVSKRALTPTIADTTA